MAKVNLTPLTTSVRGRIGTNPTDPILYQVEGRTFLRNGTPQEDPQTPSQMTYRAAMQRVSKEYRKLTFQQAEAWRVYTHELRKRENTLYRAPRRVYGAFQQINIHRLIAGETILYDPPEPVVVHTPSAAPVVELVSPQQLRIRFSHLYEAGKVIWRIHISDALDSPMRKALETQIRSATDSPTESYFVSRAFEESILLDTRSNYEAGQTLGMEVLGLSAAYTPGEKALHRRVEIKP